jgi:glycosyltransferase involved in cell wall biosynthesis
MKLLVGSSSPPDKGSGINAYVRELCEALIALGHEIHFSSPEPADFTWLKKNNIKYVKSDQFDDPIILAKKLIQYVQELNIEGVINNDNASLQNIAPALSCPFIAVGHMGRTSVASLACFRHQWTDHVVAISNDMQSVYVRKFGVPIVKCPIVYNGVINPLKGQIFLERNRALRIVFAGGYSKNKGSAYIEKAIVQHQDSWKGIKLDWFGNVPIKVKQRLRFYDFVEFHGRVGHEHFIETLKNSDVLLLPSHTEGCPMTMLEAMSYGVVPLASDGKGAMRWLITSGQDGFICHLDDWVKQLMQCLNYFLDHPEGLVKMKHATFERFEQNFQSSTTAQHIIDLLYRPTVNRKDLARKIEILRWHRPLRKDGLKSPLMDRIAIRLGWLRKAGVLDL